MSSAPEKNSDSHRDNHREDRIPFATTLHVRDHCLCLHVQRAARALARRFDDALRPLNLTHGQFSMLMSLNRPEPPSTLTAALKPLERRGLVRVAPDPADRRARRLTLTAQGRDLLAQAVPIWQTTHGELERNLPSGNANELRKSLQALL